MENNLSEKEIINKVSDVLDKLFRRVVLVSPYYEMLRELQQDIYKYQNRSQTAKQLREKGKTIRQIAKSMGYKHPGSISYLLNQ